MIRILIADDHAVVRQGLKQILADIPDIAVTGEAANGYEVLDAVRKQAFDLVMLDISMPGKGGLEVLRELRDIHPHLPVLVLTMHPEERYAVRVLKSGASGYLTKESAPDELIAAIRKLSQGGKYISSSLAEHLVCNLEKGAGPPHEALSEREYQVMVRIGSGKTVREIGDELCLSIKTVSTYRARILEKTGLRNTAEIIHYAVSNRLSGP